MSSLGEIYSSKFYEKQSIGSHRSAKIILPILFDVYRPRSVVDFGAGVGPFLDVCVELGIKDVLGIEGDWVINQHPDYIPYLYKDLNQPVKLDKRFDLAISLEVAEHLEPSGSKEFVEGLCAASDVILFSAAMPGQGGRNHINECPAKYWQGLFLERGYVLVDWIRNKIWNNADVEVWYSQNSYLYINANHPLAKIISHDPLLDIVHPHNALRGLLKNQLADDHANNIRSTWLMRKALRLGIKRTLRHFTK